MDKSSFGGLIVAGGGIILGLTMEGGSLAQIMQPTAGLIVFGGTIGAVMLQFPLPVVIEATKRLGSVFFDKSKDPHERIAEIVGYANKARRGGIVSLDKDIDSIQDPFLKKSLMLAVDGTEPQELRKMMELELDNQAEHEDHIPKVFEAAGGYSPTVGIIGASSWLDSGYAAPRRYHGSRPRNCRSVRRNHLWCRRGQPALPAMCRENQDAHPSGPNRARNDARRRRLNSRGNESENDRNEIAGILRRGKQNAHR